LLTLTRAARSNGCHLLTVKAAYHHLCRGAPARDARAQRPAHTRPAFHAHADCARTRKACAKCNSVITGAGLTTAEEQARAVEALTEQARAATQKRALAPQLACFVR